MALRRWQKPRQLLPSTCRPCARHLDRCGRRAFYVGFYNIRTADAIFSLGYTSNAAWKERWNNAAFDKLGEARIRTDEGSGGDRDVRIGF